MIRASRSEIRALRRIAELIFDWRVEQIGARYRATAYGATAGWGDDEQSALNVAMSATLRMLCSRKGFDDARLSLMRAVWVHGRRFEP